MRWNDVRWVTGVAVLVLAAAWGVACSGDSGTNPNPPNGNGDDETGTVVVMVGMDGDGLSGVTVRLFPSGSSTAAGTEQTESNGRAQFDDVEAGSYEVEIDVPEGLELDEGESSRKSVTVSGGGTGNVAFGLVTGGGDGSEIVEIHLTANFQFDPSELTIAPGTTVRWITDTNTMHTVTPRGHDEWERVVLDEMGETFTHTFNAVGTFNYFCEPHEDFGMTGTITVR